MACHTPLLTEANEPLPITMGNRTPGSRSYSDLMDTWADSVCIHQFILKPCSKAACIMCTAAYSISINAQ